MIADALGWAGSFCFGICGIPQALKARRDGHAQGLSWAFLAAWMCGEVLYIVATLLKFGIVWWMLANYAVNTVALCVILYYKITYKRRFKVETFHYRGVNADKFAEAFKRAVDAGFAELEGSTQVTAGSYE